LEPVGRPEFQAAEGAVLHLEDRGPFALSKAFRESMGVEAWDIGELQQTGIGHYFRLQVWAGWRSSVPFRLLAKMIEE
jgi:hypothetical protein